MSALRSYMCPPWPEGGYSDWPPVAARLRAEFEGRSAWLEADLFRDAFWLTAVGRPDADRAEATKNTAVALILDKNLPLVLSIIRSPTCVTEHELRDVVSEAWCRSVYDPAPPSVRERLCEWHDANQHADPLIRDRLRARCVRQMVRPAARAEIRNRIPGLGSEGLNELPNRFDPRPLISDEQPDLDRLQRAITSALNRYGPDDQLIFNLYYLGECTLQAVTGELTARRSPLSLATVHRRACEMRRAVRDEYERLKESAH
jgi:hypothetical protein